MNKEELIYKLKSNRLSDIICVNKVKTFEDVKKYTDLGYSVSKLENLINYLHETSLDVNKFYYQKSLFPQLLYMDMVNFVLLELNIFVNDGLFKSIYPNINDIVKHIKYIEDKSIKEKLMYVPDCYKLEFLMQVLSKIDNKNRYNIFIDTYSSVDFGFNNLTSKEILNIFESKTIKQKQKTINKIKDLPDVIKVYRGIGSKSLKNGYSYTLNWDIARFFAYRLSSSADCVQILEGYVQKNDIIEYITDRGEEELLILPEKVFNKKVYNYNSFDKYGVDIGVYNYNKFLLETFLKNNKDLNIINSNEHNKGHLLRVLILSQLLSEHYSLGEEYKEILYLAAVFHDIGRCNDLEDNTHGENSYHLLVEQSPNFEDDILHYLIKNHCIDDKKVLKHKDKYANLCLKILKDADALDRQRFGLKDLNSSYLRLNFSKKLSFYAFRLLNVSL